MNQSFLLTMLAILAVSAIGGLLVIGLAWLAERVLSGGGGVTPPPPLVGSQVWWVETRWRANPHGDNWLERTVRSGFVVSGGRETLAVAPRFGEGIEFLDAADTYPSEAAARAAASDTGGDADA